MTYDGTMVLPRNCVAMTTDEMEYVDGGWSGTTLKNNLLGIYNTVAVKAPGVFSFSLIAATASFGYAYAVAVWSWPVITAASIGGPGLAAIAILAGATAIHVLGNYRLFY